MLVCKVIKCWLINPTKLKLKELNKEFNNLQTFIQYYVDFGLYSANKQQALRYYKKIKMSKFYPLSIRKDLVKVVKSKSKLCQYWFCVPVKSRRGGLWLPIKTHIPIPQDVVFRESKIVKKKGLFYIHLTIEKEIKLKSYSNVLAIDLGERVIATTVLSNKQKPYFYGKNVRGIRRHYAWLRKRLGRRKLLKIIKRISWRERDKVNDTLHKISNKIVKQAVKNQALIVLGDLKGIRKKNKGRWLNKIINHMPFFKLTQMITYKAAWEGIKVIKISERYTSQTCNKCKHVSKKNRKSQGLFKCDNCTWECNADYNACLNISKKSLDYMFKNGASMNVPLTKAIGPPQN